MEPYNSLTDPHLYGYFSNEQRRKELKRAGLIGKQGEVITEATYRLNAIMAEKGMRRFNAEDDRKLDERGRRLRLLPKVNMPTEDFCREKSYKYRSASSSRYFSPMKSNSYDRIKSAPDYVAKKPTYTTYQDVMTGVRAKYPWSSSSPYLWPLPSTDVIRLNISGSDRQRCSGYLSYSALPAIRKSQDFEFYDNKGRKDEMLRLSGTLHIFPTTSSFTSSSTCGGNSNSIFQRYHGNASNSSALFSTCHKSNDTFNNNNNNSQPRLRCIVTMHYYGDPIRLSEMWSYRKDEVIVEQQHCGGNTLVVFRGRLAPGSDFSFPSMRRKDFPFSLTIYIEHQQNTRISVCCEAKHKRGVRLGGGNGCFGIVDVENPVHCESCSEAKKHKKLERKAKKQKKTKASFLKDEVENENEGIPQKRPRDDDDDDDDKDKIKQTKQNRKKEKPNKLKDDDEYEDDFENESDENTNPSSSQQKKDKKRQSSEKSSDSQRSTKSETNKIPDKYSKKKTRKSEEGGMETEESPKNVQNKELRQSQDSANLNLAKSNPKKEADSTNSETPESKEKKRSASKNKKMLKQKSAAKVIESPPILADSAKIISGKTGQILSENKKETPRKERDASKSNKNKTVGKPLQTADDPMKSDSSIRAGKRLLSTEETPRMSQISETEKMDIDDKGDPDRNKKNETGTETSRGNNVKSKTESLKSSSASDRKKKNEEEYERKLREVAKDCVAQIYRSLEEAMKNEDD